MAQPSTFEACLEIAAEMRAVANDPAADITPADRRALVIWAAAVEQVAEQFKEGEAEVSKDGLS